MKGSGGYMKRLSLAKEIAIMLLAPLCIACGMQLFLAPAGINAGGFLGISQIIGLWAPERLYLGIIYFILNVPLIVLSLFFFTKKFVVKTLITVFLISVYMTLGEVFGLPRKLGLVSFENITLIALAGGALLAIGIALLLIGEGSAGGTDIISLILQKKYRLGNASRLLLLFDLVVIAVYCGIERSLPSFLYAVAALASYQITLEFVFGAFSNAVMFEIVTSDSQAIIKAIDEELGRGSTMFKAIGTYTKENKEVVVCVVRKRQESKARELVKRIAPDSFAYTIPIKEVIGKGFRNIYM
jgi:uncharacterized membrane-anchored protein YitT (DUF2179 family)